MFSPPPPTPATDPNPFSFGDNLRYALVHEDIVALGQRLCRFLGGLIPDDERREIKIKQLNECGVSLLIFYLSEAKSNVPPEHLNSIRDELRIHRAGGISSIEYSTITPFVNSFAVHHVIFPVSKIKPVIMPDKESFSVQHVSTPFTNISIAIRPAVFTLPFF